MKITRMWRGSLWQKLSRRTLLIMRFSVILLFGMLLQVSANSLAQKVVFEKNQLTYKELFKEIEKQTGLITIYSNQQVNKREVINIGDTEQDVSELYQALLEEKGLTFELIDDYIVIKRAIPKAAINQEIQQSQKKMTLLGTVLDETGIGLPGVAIMIKGTTIGTVTDMNGYFSLETDENPGATLSISSLGFETYEVIIGGQRQFNVTLIESVEGLGEVVVTGYQTLSKERVSGAFAVLNEEDLDVRITSSLSDKLEGTIPGLQIDKENNIIIRGSSTLFGETKPLIVVDNFPTEIELDDLNPDDIENITVLKDAASASIWGTRAANGVIVITTKKAKKQKGIQVEASYYKTISQKYDFEDLNLMNSEEIVDLELDILNSFPDVMTNMMYGINREYSIHDPVVSAYLRRYAEVPDELKITDQQYQAEIARLKSANGYEQFKEHVTRNYQNDQFNIALRSASDNNSFIGTISYNKTKGFIKSDSDDRLNLNLKNSLKFNDFVSLDLGLNIVYKQSETGGIDSYYYRSHQPYELIYDENGNKYKNYSGNLTYKSQYEDLGLDYSYNALDQMNAVNNTTKYLNTRANASLNIKITKWASISSTLQLERSSNEAQNYTSPDDYYWRRTLNDVYYDGKYNNLPYGGKMNYIDSYANAWTVRNQLNLNKELSSKHRLNGIIGNEIRRFTTNYTSSWLYGYDPVTDKGKTFDVYGWENYEYSGRDGKRVYVRKPETYYEPTENREVSYYTNASYSYDDLFNLTASFRLDQANNFGFTNKARNNVLWSFGANYNIKNHWLQHIDQVNRLNFRATYGVNGNRPGGGYTAALTGTVLDNSFYGPNTIQAIQLSNAANPDLRSEKVYTSNIGIDYAFLKNRIRGSFDVYKRVSKDMIGQKKLNPTSGWDVHFLNFAEMENKGFEVAISGTPLKSRSFAWDVDFNLSYNDNKITKIEGNTNTARSHVQQVYMDYISYSPGQLIEGKPVGRMYVYRYAGVDEDGQVLLYGKDDEKIGYAQAANGDPEGVVKYEGTLVAPYFGSLANTFTYKNWSLGFIMNYKFGHKFYGPWTTYGLSYLYSNTAMVKDFVNSTKDNTTQYLPITSPYSPHAFYNGIAYPLTDQNVYNAAWIKLSDVNLNYNVPEKYLKWIRIQNATLRFQVKNVAQWVANDKGWDPESVTMIRSQYFGVQKMFENPITFVAGLKVNF